MDFYAELKKLKTVYQGMFSRCYNKNCPGYKNYGGRGIKVCNEWKEQKTFLRWAFRNGWEIGLQIDRENNNLGYFPENCHFVTSKINSRNRRTSRIWYVEGKVFDSSTDAAEYFKVTSGVISRWCNGQRIGKIFYPTKPGCCSVKLY